MSESTDWTQKHTQLTACYSTAGKDRRPHQDRLLSVSVFDGLRFVCKPESKQNAVYSSAPSGVQTVST